MSPGEGAGTTDGWTCPWKRAGTLLAMGALVGVLNNLSAGPTRQLAWIGDYPEKRERPSVETTTVVPRDKAPDSGRLEESTTGDPRDRQEDVGLPDVDPSRAYVAVGRAQVLALHSGGAIFVDARRTSQYEEGHIRGAHSIAVWESGVDEKIDDLSFVTGGDEEAAVVIYCNGGDCEDSHMLAEKLWLQNFLHVLVYSDGYPDWLDAGGAVSTGGAS